MKFDVAIRHVMVPSDYSWRVEIRQGTSWNIEAPVTATRDQVQQWVTERFYKKETGIMWIESESRNLYGKFVPLADVERGNRE